ncbi:hypothetical protein OXX79_000066 [Metschnikowia pulcherrima]
MFKLQVILAIATIACSVSIDNSAESVRNLESEDVYRPEIWESEDSEDWLVSRGMQESESLEPFNGVYATYLAYRKEGEIITWASKVIEEEGCSSAFGQMANTIQWDVMGQSCGYVLFKEDGCKGPVSFDTQGFNVVDDGSRMTPGFRSVYFQCR